MYLSHLQVIVLGGGVAVLALVSFALAAALVHRQSGFVAARDAERSFRTLYDNTSEGVFRCTMDGTLVSANPALVRLHGYEREQDLLARAQEVTQTWYADPARGAELGRMLIEKGRLVGVVSAVRRHSSGEIIWVEENMNLVCDPRTGAPRYLEGTVREVTDKVRRKEMQARHDKIAAVVPGCLYQCRLSKEGAFSIPYASVGIESVFGIKPADVLADVSLVMSMIHPDDRQTVRDSIMHSARTTQPWHSEYRVVQPDGRPKWILGHAVPELEPDGSVLWHGFLTDITARKAAESRVYEFAFSDQLTGLPNRSAIVEKVQMAVAASRGDSHWGALLFIDLDQFKVLNDSKGHHVGDQLLVAVAQRLRALVHEEDFVGRLGGDEFVILLHDLAIAPEVAERQVTRFLDRLRDALATPFEFDGFPFRTSASIGVALFHGGECSADELLKRADLAMYRAKGGAHGSASFFAPAMQSELEERLALSTELRDAIEEGKLTVHYQPQVDERGDIFGVEALLRWEHPQRGSIPPVIFIPLAEQSGLAEQVNAFVLSSACATLARWADVPGLDKLQMSVNVGGRQLDSAIVDLVNGVLDVTGADASRLTIELTERIMLDNADDVETALTALKASGVRIFLDDFGTGYSSLQHLRRLPIDAVKIDCNFVRDIETDLNDRVIVQTIINIARNLGLSVVAEGVETEMQALLLRRFGCREFQGYLYARPMPREEIERRYSGVAHVMAPVMVSSRLVV